MPGFDATMHEWGQGKLHSGSKTGPKVKSQKQALAIAFSEAGERKKKAAPKRRKAPHGEGSGDLIRRAMGGK